MSSPGERFLVTGALGCIGAWTVRTLVREGTPVVGFDLGRDPRRLALIMTPDELAQVRLVQGDITDLAAIERALEVHDITNVIHLAALQVPFCRADPPLGAQVNVTGTVNVFEAVRRQGRLTTPVVYTGSIGMFSLGDADPTTGRLEEDAIARPGNHYGVYKLANEGNARIYWADTGVASVGIRPMTVYGAGRDQGMTSSPTAAIAAAVLGVPFEISFGGSTLFQYAEDVARTLILASRSQAQDARVFNLGGSRVALEDWVAAIDAAVPGAATLLSLAPTELPFPSDIAHDRVAELGAVPVTPYRDAIAATADIYRGLAAEGRLMAAEHGVVAAQTPSASPLA
ncbi:MAG TPA: NAD(P)-dependent oxidoreductase [Candidatus Limnocylindrales bacterium]|jgi:nucleoside-diphosphate-sugar epimerase|nr:NAD(P)-dependent oxidoreductase [Candidatus Limnocylindrales bacterium]